MRRTKSKKRRGKTKQRVATGYIPERGRCPTTHAKRIYLKPEASRVATALNRSTSERLVPYPCPDGHGWHVGHDFL